MTNIDADTETCSWCTAEVLDRELREIRGGDGARICKACQQEHVFSLPPGGEVVVFVR